MRERELVAGILEALKGLGGRRAAILLHVGGDPDSLASAYVLSRMLSAWSVDIRSIAVPLNISDHTERMAAALGVSLEVDLPDAEAYVAVDVGSPSQLANFYERLGGELIVIDHHEQGGGLFRGKVFCSTNYQSTSEMVLELAELAGYKLSGAEASALFAGIYFDTVRLTVADSETLKKVGILGELGAEPRTLLQKIDSPIDYSERVARIKAAKRAEFYRCGDVLVGMTRVSAFKPSAARSLLAIGAHIALVGDEEGGEAEVTLRQVPEMVDQLRLNLVKDVVEPIAKTLSGSGGGHASAARLRAKGGLDNILGMCLHQIAYLLGASPVRVAD
ncbi:MAG: DHH family phosphoesterase [Nitrososphaerota archaeon]|nr:DHH family phosphoesterase [Candidatus Calditenuaceae archaeon]MDW8072759.1 DHH family phosphoesterase [Nitrososphaerota archaeon]